VIDSTFAGSRIHATRRTRLVKDYPTTADANVQGLLIEKALAKCNNVKTKAADFLGINRNTLNKKVKDLGIEAVEGE